MRLDFVPAGKIRFLDEIPEAMQPNPVRFDTHWLERSLRGWPIGNFEILDAVTPGGLNRPQPDPNVVLDTEGVLGTYGLEALASIMNVHSKPKEFVIVNAIDAKTKAKQHKRRRNQSEAYHRKVQARWNARAARGDKRMIVNSEVKQLRLSAKIAQQIEELAKNGK